MTDITQADRDAVRIYLQKQMTRVFRGETDLHRHHLAEAFARHAATARSEGAALMRDAALLAIRRVQYDPAPYTACKAALEKLDIAIVLGTPVQATP